MGGFFSPARLRSDLQVFLLHHLVWQRELARFRSEVVRPELASVSEINKRGAESPQVPYAMRFYYYAALVLTFAYLAGAQVPSGLPLWPDGAPGALGKEDKDIPSLTPYLADSAIATGAAMVILPGGGYGGLAPHEGKGYADWLVTNGVSCFVVKYRLGSQGYHHPRMLEDAARAVRVVRARASEWKVDPKRVGI